MQGPIYNSDEEIDLQEPVNDAKRSKGLRSQWVQCDNPECQKWRRIEYDADLDSLAQEKWICNMNEGSELQIILATVLIHRAKESHIYLYHASYI